MGVDHFHGVYAADIAAAGGVQAAKEVEHVLRSYGLIDEPSSRWCLDASDIRQLTGDDDVNDVSNIGVRFRSMSGKHMPIVTHILGAAAELVEGDEWAWAEFSVVSGRDYRLATEGESGPGVRIVKPSMLAGQELAPFMPEEPKTEPRSLDWGHMAFGCRAFDASTGCTAPECELDWFQPLIDGRTGKTLPNPEIGFTGLWRTALLIHTKLQVWPWSTYYGGAMLPESDFKADLWSALGGSAYELGYSC